MKVVSALLALPVLFAAPLAMAQDVPADAPAEEAPVEPVAVETTATVEATTPTPVLATESPVDEALAERGITLNGFVSGSYSYNLNAPTSRTNGLRGNDAEDQTFAVDAAEVVVQLAPTPGNFGFRLDLATGFVPGFQQAFGSYVTPSGLRFDFGKFMTHMGYEVVDGYDGYNDNFSRGLLFQQTIPVLHVGAKVSKSFTDMVSGTLLLVNGWETGNDLDADDTPAIGFQVAIAASPMVSIYINYLGGSEGVDAEAATLDFLRHTANVVVVAKPSDTLSFALDTVYVNQAAGDADAVSWYGIAGYAKLNLAPSFDLALRAEFIGDPDGAKFTPAGGLEELTAYSVTLTPSYTVVPGYVVRGDLRLDGASEDIFETDDLEGSGTQVTLAANLVAAF